MKEVTSKTLRADIRNLGPGDTLQLRGGSYREPIVVADIWGTRERPITIRGSKTTGGSKTAVFGSDKSFADYSPEANRLAQDLEREGRGPGLYHIADEAYLILRNCQWIVVEDLSFRRCWPTAIYMDNCQNIRLRGLDFEEGTLAIAASGERTRHLIIEKCRWRQDVSAEHALWRSIPWRRVHGYWKNYDKDLHGSQGSGHVDVDRDARAYDGDFFRAWNIIGFVVFRDNELADAFNAIHFFNSTAGATDRSFSRNVLIENNRFERIRDNAVEPEGGAWNWIVRHNQFIDCYSPFSLEMTRSGYFYIYGNLGWSTSRPGPKEDPHSLGRLLKLPKRHQGDGPHYVVHNSWYLRAPIIRKKRFSNFLHLNNAVDYNRAVDEQYNPEKTSPFGRDWQDKTISTSLEEQFEAERSHFTKDWHALQIRIDGDVIHHRDFPELLRASGYPIGPFALGADPGFICPGQGGEGLMLKTRARGRRRALSFVVEYADGHREEVCPHSHGGDVGAWQGKNLFSLRKQPLWVIDDQNVG